MEVGWLHKKGARVIIIITVHIIVVVVVVVAVAIIVNRIHVYKVHTDIQRRQQPPRTTGVVAYSG